MNQNIYTFQFAIDWKIINDLRQIDIFGGSWSSIEKREGDSLKQLRSVATVESVGASTRIEGSKMMDSEVAALIKDLDISKLEERDEQEVTGYFQTQDMITESYQDIDITENNIKSLHNILMRYSTKDEWHKGEYKKQSNVVEATNPDGSKYVVFQTTAPGIDTEDAMRKLIDWYNAETEVPPLIRSALFVYDFLSIHPFQDGNGRLSRLIGTLLLLKHSYSWIQYISFEHEIEQRKKEYYRVLMDCQKQRPGEDIYPWVSFFLNCLTNIQGNLVKKLERHNTTSNISVKEKKVYAFIESHPGVQSGEISQKLGIPLPTIKKMLTGMVAGRLLMKHGVGKGTTYTAENTVTVKKDLYLKLTNEERTRALELIVPNSQIEIKKIVLTPSFKWMRPEDWSTRLTHEGLEIHILCGTSKDAIHRQSLWIPGYNNEYLFQPVFNLHTPIVLSMKLFGEGAGVSDYPIIISLELAGAVPKFSFEVLVVYDVTE